MQTRITGYLVGTAMFAAVVLALLPLRTHVNTATIALALLIVVLLTATAYGSFPALAVSILCLLAFNYFFTPPYHTFMVADPQNWVALFAFLLTAVIAGSLSAKEKKRAEEAQKLYHQLQEAFDKASQAEALKQSEKLKSALLDAVTHDLRTPLTSMKAAVTAVLSRSSEMQLDEEGKRELLEVVDAEIDRMNGLVEELIQMAKIEAGAMQPQRRWSNMEEIVTNALDRAAGITSGHHVRTNLEEDLPLVRVDEKIIAEVLFILIENATKFSPKGSAIIISATKNANAIQVSVEDSGIGIPAAFRSKVFDKFFRILAPVEKGGHTQAPGLGMGLAIARALVEAHGGVIQVEEPRTGSGARLTFTIPLQAEAIAVSQP